MGTDEISRTWEKGGQFSKRKIMNPTKIGSIREQKVMWFGWKVLWGNQETESTQWMALRVCLIRSSVKSDRLRTLSKQD